MSYFNTCLVAPESFEISNDKTESVLDNEGARNQEEMFMAMFGGQMGGGFQEKLQSN